MSQTAEVYGLARLGWGADHEQEFEQYEAAGLVPGRVAVQHRGAYDVLAADGEVRAGLPGRLLHDAGDTADLPAVGDWVALDPPAAGQSTIRAVLPRRTAFVRTAASDQHRISEQQVVAANVDTVFLVSALAEDYNLRRLERYLVLAWESGAQPVVVLTKTDLSRRRRRRGRGGRVGRVRRARARGLERHRRGRGRATPVFHRATARWRRSARPASASRR